jgi:membrane protein YqaA with SNARE-associated domain
MNSSPDAHAPPVVPPRRNAFRRLYDWVLHWAETPYGTPALAGLSFAESSFFPIPPDVLQIALSVSKPKRSFYYAAVSTIASVLGGILGWYIGYGLWTALQDFFYNVVPGVTPENIDYVGQKYHDNAFLAIFAAAFTPIPYKVFTISAGVFHEHVALGTLILASFLGRGLRFFLVATCIYIVGPPAKQILDKYLEWITVALCVLLMLGFVAIKYLPL